MIDHRDLAPPGDEYDVLDSGVERLLNTHLDLRRIHDGQHFLGYHLGGGQKTGAQTGSRKNGLTNFAHEVSSPLEDAGCGVDEGIESSISEKS